MGRIKGRKEVNKEGTDGADGARRPVAKIKKKVCKWEGNNTKRAEQKGRSKQQENETGMYRQSQDQLGKQKRRSDEERARKI